MADYQSEYTGLQIDKAVAAGLELKESPQLALANLGGRPNRNIARNPDFKINQRNFTSDNWTSGYGPDGWVSTGGGHLEYSGGSVKTINQYLHQYYDLGEIDAGIYTISAFCTGNISGDLGFWGGESAKYQSTNYANGFASATVEITEDMVNPTKKGYLYILCENSGTISTVKLEKSPFQTLAYKDFNEDWQSFETLNYVEELERNLYYQYVMRPLSGGTSEYGHFALLLATTANTLRGLVSIPTIMRTTPAASIVKNESLKVIKQGTQDWSTAYASAIFVYSAVGNVLHINLELNESVLEVGSRYELRTFEDRDCAIIFDANL